jgi:hypothetical protein
MLKSILKILLLSLVLSTITGHSQTNPEAFWLPVLCNQKNSAAFIAFDPEQKPASSGNWKKKMVNWMALLKVGPRKNFDGDPLRSGSRVASVKCGTLTIRVAGGFLNPNAQGELGAMDFPLVEIMQGRKLLLQQTALETCAIDWPRYEFFGKCPDQWANSIEVMPTASGFQVNVRRVFHDTQSKKLERTDVYYEKSP